MSEEMSERGLPRLEAIAPERRTVETAIATACARIAPLWPLTHFVAVNPFLGFTDRSFHATCAMMYRVARIDMLMPRAFYREAVARGEIADRDLAQAIAEAPRDWRVPASTRALKDALQREVAVRVRHPAHVPSVAEVLDSLAGGDPIASGTAFMIDEISRWCAAYFDEGQSVWRLPTCNMSVYAAWRESVRYDPNPEVMGVRAFRSIIAALPADPVSTVIELVLRQGVPARAVADYLHQALLDVNGWASFARYIGWNAELEGRSDDTLVHLLAIRLAWGYALFEQHVKDQAFREAWHSAMAQAALPPNDERIGDDPDLSIDLLAHEAYEIAFRRRLFARIAEAPAATCPARPAVQAAFCIDVRSEVFRRAFEAESPGVQTIGFAGFFGFPIEYVPLGHMQGGAQCPVLLKPAVTVCEHVRGAPPQEEARILWLRVLRRRVDKAWKSFKTAAVSSFTFVETAGLLFAGKIVSDSLALTRPVHDPNTDGIDTEVLPLLGPQIAPGVLGDRTTGFTLQTRTDMAEAVLRRMTFTSGFARCVLLCGHGSTTVNNPYASALDCAACGGYTGEANARVAAAVLNDAPVRGELRARGIDIPDDTWFLGCLHDTTTDRVKIYDADLAPDTHQAEIAEIRAMLKRAGATSRRERAPKLGLAPQAADLDRKIFARSRDWSQIRPEWGNAGNAAFIAAPRSRTRGVDLDGRVFLHEYDWRQDAGFQTLELIMTAPMVVANWLNLQYYASTVNNRMFGSGNKVLHNVAGNFGVLEGNGGDLKVGLPWQSVHDGRRFLHEPHRLNVVIEAPLDAMNAVIERHTAVRHLVDHRWLHLFAMEDGAVAYQYCGMGQWEPVAADATGT